MKYDLSAVLRDENGDTAKDTINGKDIPATFQRGITRALISDTTDRRPSADEKAKRFELFCKIVAAPIEVPIDLSIDEIAIIKQAADVYPTLIYGQIVKFLNQK